MLKFKQEDKLLITDIRVTSKRGSNKKVREAQLTPLKVLSNKEKLLRGLKKKLHAINNLIEKEQTGAILDEQQRIKVDNLDAVMNDINELLGENTAEGDDVNRH